jgi:hypothetical protein
VLPAVFLQNTPFDLSAKRPLWLAFWLVISQGWCLSVNAQPTARPLDNAHAHNDYQHPRPLLDAMEQGFTSIEADIFLVDGQLLVAHYLRDVAPERTLENLYLQPLRKRVRDNGGSVYPGGGTLTLLVDIKSDAEATYSELERQLKGYPDLISVTTDGVHQQKPVTVVVSGNRPIDAIKASNPRYVGIDGRLSDLDSELEASMMPLISDNWRVHFRYRGRDSVPEAERKKLRDIVERTHRAGRRLRFWATPESEDLWAS